MVVCCYVCSLLHLGAMQDSFPFSADGNVVDLVLGLSLRRSTVSLVDGLVGKDGASNDQFIESAEGVGQGGIASTIN